MKKMRSMLWTWWRSLQCFIILTYVVLLQPLKIANKTDSSSKKDFYIERMKYKWKFTISIFTHCIFHFHTWEKNSRNNITPIFSVQDSETYISRKLWHAMDIIAYISGKIKNDINFTVPIISALTVEGRRSVHTQPIAMKQKPIQVLCSFQLVFEWYFPLQTNVYLWVLWQLLLNRP